MEKKYVLILCLLFLVNVFGQKSTVSKLVVEGEIEFISKLPNPSTMDYPDCNYSAILNLNTDSGATDVTVVFKGIEDRKLVTASFRVGDKVRLTLIPFEDAEVEIRQIQLVDEVDDFDMKVYYAIQSKKIKKYSENTNNNTVTSTTEKVESIQIVPKDLKSTRIRKKNIKSEIKRIEKLLKSHGGTWEQWEKDINGFKAEYAKATKAEASKWVENSFFSAGKAYAETNEGNFVEAMTRFNAYLKQFNIDLIVIRIPFKGEVSGGLFSDKLSDYVTNPYALKVTSDLLKNDVEVIDILPKLIEERMKSPLTFWYNDFEEAHPAEPVSWIVAKELKSVLSRYPEYKDSPRVETNLIDKVGINTGGPAYKWPKGNKSFSSNQLIGFKAVVDSTGEMLQLNFDKTASPFLFIGNSFMAYPALRKGGSIPHYFTYETGILTDVYFRSGGAGFGRLIYKKGLSYLENRRAIVYIALPSDFQGTVPEIPLGASIHKDDYTEKPMLKLGENTWSKHTVFIPEISARNILHIQKNGHLRAIGKETGKSDGGDVIVTIPDVAAFKKNDILKIKFEFRSVGYGNVVVNYGGQEKSFFRSNDSKDTNIETVYFKIKEKTDIKKFKISFRRLKRKQVIKEIDVSLLRSK